MPDNNRLLQAICIGAVAGMLCGWFFGPAMLRIAWLGNLFLDALKMTIIPLIVAALISGVAAMGDVRRLQRLGGMTVLYYLVTTGIAVFIGLVLVNLLHPGAAVADLAGTPVPTQIASGKAVGITDIIGSLITSNVVRAAADMKLLPIIVFSLLFATALTTIGSRGRPVIDFFNGLNDVMMKLVLWIMYFSPVGVFALIAAQLGKAGGGAAFWRELSSVGMYTTTVVAGLVLDFALLFVILAMLGRRGTGYLVIVSRALLTAFGTASSSATLPLTMECAAEARIDERSVRFVLPLGSTVNMNGTALYEAVAAMFIAQAYGLHLGMTQQILIFLTATLAAIGAAGIPQAGLVTMIIVLTAVKLPVQGIGMLLAVDWFLDRLRTSVNVWGDCVGAAVMDRIALSPIHEEGEG